MLRYNAALSPVMPRTGLSDAAATLNIAQMLGQQKRTMLFRGLDSNKRLFHKGFKMLYVNQMTVFIFERLHTEVDDQVPWEYNTQAYEEVQWY